MQGAFSEMVEIASLHGIKQVDGITFDLGVSSTQLDEALRGFSFQSDGPLDNWKATTTSRPPFKPRCGEIRVRVRRGCGRESGPGRHLFQRRSRDLGCLNFL